MYCKMEFICFMFFITTTTTIFFSSDKKERAKLNPSSSSMISCALALITCDGVAQESTYLRASPCKNHSLKFRWKIDFLHNFCTRQATYIMNKNSVFCERFACFIVLGFFFYRHLKKHIKLKIKTQDLGVTPKSHKNYTFS